jgi:L-ascorbate metabolism protein UlaG (beta-lactamase superfamily)
MKLHGTVWPATALPPWPGKRGNLRAHPAWSMNPIYPLRNATPFLEIMRAVKIGFDAGQGDRQLAMAIQQAIGGDGQLGELIDHEAAVSGGPLGRRKLIFESFSTWRLAVYQPGKRQPDEVWQIPRSRVSAETYRAAFRDPGSWLQPASCPTPCDPQQTGGALVRREHASVEIVSSGGTRIIVDPIFRSPLLRCAAHMPVPEAGVAAAFVTHSHGDHFNIATLDWLAASGTSIYVPVVPRASLLSEDMASELALCGVPAKSCETGSLIDIGDVTVEALPFFGEQPSARVSPAEAGLRNWGNCYRVDTPGFSVLILADSGTDPAGNMPATIHDSVRRRGPIDVVLGSLRNMYLPFDVYGLSGYYAVQPMNGLRDDHSLWRRGKLPSATLGPAGTAEVCAEAKARVFLPYAHGLAGYGQPVAANPFGPRGVSELLACRGMAEELSKIGSEAVVTTWNPGDAWTPGDGRHPG